ncbi:MAG: hypothetical protein ACFBSD_14525 [Paracoccaceae bacterium]
MRHPEFLLFLAASGLVHAAVLAGLPAERIFTPRATPEPTVAAAAADARLSALVEAWDRPPETGSASELTDPETGAPLELGSAPDADAAVEASVSADVLETAAGPGSRPAKPIFAKMPTPNTAAPPSLAGPLVEAPSSGTGRTLATALDPGPSGLANVSGPSGLSGASVGGGFGPALRTAPVVDDDFEDEDDGSLALSAPGSGSRGAPSGLGGPGGPGSLGGLGAPGGFASPGGPGGAGALTALPRRDLPEDHRAEGPATESELDTDDAYARRLARLIADRMDPGPTGTADLLLEIGADGALLALDLRNSTGDSARALAALDAARDAAPFPTPGPSRREILVTVEF